MPQKDYGQSDPSLLNKIPHLSNTELKTLAENADRYEAHWLAEAIADEQIARGGAGNMTALSVREVLIRNAKSDQVTTYKKVAAEFGVKWGLTAFVTLKKVLGDVVDLDHSEGTPFLSSLVMSEKDNVCGKGFFTKAKSLGRTVNDENAFMKEEQQKVFDHW
ncbi:hypothetical protein JCM17960_30650 [Magnetospira thiophila]